MSAANYTPEESASYSAKQSEHKVARRVLVIGDDSHKDDIAAICDWAEARMLSAHGGSQAEQSLSDVAVCDVIWLNSQSLIEPALVKKITSEVERRRCALVCDISYNHIDDYFSDFIDLPEVQFLCRADRLDRYAALATALAYKPISAAVQNNTSAALELLEELRREIIRMSIALPEQENQHGLERGSDLSQEGQKGQEGQEEYIGYESSSADDVHAPTRSYRVSKSTRSSKDVIIPGPAAEIHTMLRHRRIREKHFPPKLFSDPAWDILLDLYAAQLEKRTVSVSSLCIAAVVPPTTGLRWISKMAKANMLKRSGDSRDGRLIHVTLSDETAEAMKKCLTAMGLKL